MRGHVEKLPSGRWRLSVSAGRDENGRRRRARKTISAPTRAAAEEELHRFALEVAADHRPHTSTPGTVDDLLDRWFAAVEVADHTRADWRSAIDKHIRPRIGDVAAHKLRGADLDDFYAAMRADGVSVDRIRRCHTILRLAYAQAVKWREVAYNPTVDATKPKPVQREPVSPTPDEVDRLIAAAAGDSFGGLDVWVIVAADTGARVDEVCRLRWGDFNADDRSLLIVPTKNRRPRRVSLGASTVEALKRWRTACAEQSLAAGAPFDTDSFMFRDPVSGRRWRADVLGHRLLHVRRRSGLEHVELRHLRHYVATQLIAAGMDPVEVAYRLGHGRASTTTDIYAAWVPARDREAADILERLRRRSSS